MDPEIEHFSIYDIFKRTANHIPNQRFLGSRDINGKYKWISYR
jgi:hypothetical protein